ncbi:MAG TPA: SdpI family protein [Candidatus Nitrosotalea sp.]|nr:SdpI family protein [Candidatus Nitrosotalea sp.]
MGTDGKLQNPPVEPSIDRRTALVITCAVLAFELGIAGYGFSRVPFGSRVAVHWDVGGHPNGYGAAFWAFLLVPFLTLAVSALLALVPSIEPRRRNLNLSGTAYRATWISVLLLMAGVQALIVLSAVGVARSDVGARLVPAGVGLVLMVVGNYLGKVRSNFFFGIRTPWTLSSERSWNRTHRLGGRLLVLLGLVAVVTPIFPWAGVVALVAGVPIVIVVLVVYSYVEWSRDSARLKV